MNIILTHFIFGLLNKNNDKKSFLCIFLRIYGEFNEIKHIFAAENRIRLSRIVW